MTAIGRRSPRSRAARAATARWWLGAMPTSAREPPSGRTRAIDQLRSAGLGVARDDAARGDVRPALVLEEARDRQLGEVGIVLDELLARRIAADVRIDGRLQRLLQVAPRVPARRRRAPRRSARGSAAGWRRAASRCRARARCEPARGRARRGAPQVRRRDRASRRPRPGRPSAASWASHGRSDWASAVDTERARAHELDDRAAVGPDRVAGGDEVVALAHLLAGAGRAAAERRAAAHVHGLRRHDECRARAAPRRPRPPRSAGGRRAAPS